VDRGDEGPPRPQEGPGQIEEVQEVGAARGCERLLERDPRRAGVEAPPREAERPDGKLARADRAASRAGRKEREAEVGEVGARLVERA
jgi:hypothetical protein